MNKDYILGKIKPYLNDEKVIAEEDFNILFSKLEKKKQYEVINILIEAGIDIEYGKRSYKNNLLTNKPINIGIDTIKNLSNEQLCVIYQQGNKLALEALLTMNEKLVWSRAIKFSKLYKHKLDEEDLLQYGMIGMIKAAERFDVHKEAKFATYAVWWIDQSIHRSIMNYGFTVRLPVHFFEQINMIISILRKNPGISKLEIIELAKSKGMNREKTEEVLSVLDNVITLSSLNALIGEDEESELGDFISFDYDPSVEEQVEYIHLKEEIERALDTLTPKEEKVLELRFGLKDGVARTLEEVGTNFNVTRERIRQIEAKALRKLRHPSRSKKLKDFL